MDFMFISPDNERPETDLEERREGQEGVRKNTTVVGSWPKV